MLSMANWDNDNAQKCRIRIDEKKLGFRPTQVYLPEIDELQPAGEIDLNGEIEIAGDQRAYCHPEIENLNPVPEPPRSGTFL